MTAASFQFTIEQRDVLLSAEEAITATVPEANKRFVIISEDQYDKLCRLLPVDEVDLPFFDCEELAPRQTR